LPKSAICPGGLHHAHDNILAGNQNKRLTVIHHLPSHRACHQTRGTVLGLLLGLLQ
jgi:hypothetical protein